MSLKDTFNNRNNYSFSRETDAVLRVSNNLFNFFFDFGLRLMISGQGDATPFAQLDRDMLVEMRDRFVALGGKPPELPAEAPANPGNARSLRP